MMDKPKRWYIGIDFGTSNTYIVAHDGKNAYTARSFIVAGKDNPNIPTIITQDVVGDFRMCYIGEEANDHPLLRTFRDLKNAARKITPDNGSFGRGVCEYPFNLYGLNTQIEFGNADYSLTSSVRELLVTFFREILHVDKADKYNINRYTVDTIVIGCPVVDKKNVIGIKATYEDTLKEIFAECFTGNKDDKAFQKKVLVKAEPELAGTTHFFAEREQINKTVLVVDIGGGTTDFSVLKYNGNTVNAENIGSCEVAGNAIDSVIFDLLPDGIPKSKKRCMEWKEQIFAKDAIPIPTGELKYADMGSLEGKRVYLYYYGGSQVENGIVLESGKLFVNWKEQKSGKSINDVYNRIGTALKGSLESWKIRHASEKIDTVFFVGGTSIITPLREKLCDVVEQSVGKCETKMLFGKDAKIIKVDSDNPLDVTCYSAVAIGACIMAMGGTERFCVKPEISYKGLNGGEGTLRFSSDELIMKTYDGLPFAYLPYDKSDVDTWLSINKFRPVADRRIELASGDWHRSYGISSAELEKVMKGLLIYTVLKTSGIDVKACDCGNPSFSDDAELAEAISNATPIKLIPIV